LVTHTETTFTNDTINYATSYIIKPGAGHDFYTQDIVFTNDSIDITDEDIRRFFVYGPKIYAPGAHAVGVTTIPNSEDFDTPLVILGMDWLRFSTNYGTDIDFTEVGTSPAIDRDTIREPGSESDYRSAQGFRGEAWGQCDLCGWIFPQSQLVRQPSTGRTVCTTGPTDYDKEDPQTLSPGERFFF
jgi:hypothetical protein